MTDVWRKYLSVESLREMSPNDPISPLTILPLALAEAELAEKYIQKCDELRHAIGPERDVLLERVGRRIQEACIEAASRRDAEAAEQVRAVDIDGILAEFNEDR